MASAKPTEARLAVFLALAAGAVVLTTQVGALAGVESLSSLGPGYSPLHSHSALLLTLLVGATLLQSLGSSPGSSVAGRSLAWLVTALASIRVAAWLEEEAPRSPAAISAASLEMSVITATCLALSAASLVATNRNAHHSRRQLGAALALLPCIVTTVTLFLYLGGVQQLYGTAGPRPPSLPAVLACFLVALAQLARAGSDTWPWSWLQPPSSSPSRPLSRLLGLTFLVLTALILVGGASYVRSQRQDVMAEAREDLATLERVKNSQFQAWLHERQADATMIASSRLFQERLRQELSSSAQGPVAADVREWMEALASTYGYHAVALFDAQGNPRATTGPLLGRPIPPPDKHPSASAMSLVFGDLAPDRSHTPIPLNLWVPIPLPGGHLLGALLLQVDGRTAMAKAMESWPTRYGSSELLILPQADSPVVIHLRPADPANGAISYVRAQNDPDCCTVRTLRNAHGLVRSRDHRGVLVLAAVAPLPGTPWLLAAKVDENEVLAGVRRVATQAATVALALVLGVAAFLGQVLQRYETRVLQRQYAEERDRRRLADRLDQILQEANDILLLLNTQGRIIEANLRASECYGYSQEELVGMDAILLRVEDAREGFHDPLGAATASNGTRFETTHRRKDGSTLPVEVSSRLTHFEDESYVLAVVRDLTSTRQAEAVAQARLRLLDAAGRLGHADFLRATVDEAEHLTRSSMGFYHFFEADQATLSLQVWSSRTRRDHCPGESPGRHANLEEAGIWADCVRQRQPVLCNDYAAHPHHGSLPPGHPPVQCFIAIPIIRGGAIVAIMGVGNKSAAFVARDIEVVQMLADLAWDIAERKRAEEALRESQRKIATLVSNLPGIAYRCLNDANWTMEFISEGCQALTGYRVEDLVGNHHASYTSLILEEDRTRVWDTVQEALAEGRAFQMMYRIRDASGTTRWVWEQGRGVFDDQGGLVAIEGYIVDFSEHKLIEDTLVESEFHNRALVKALPDPILQVSDRGLVLTCDTPEEGTPWISRRNVLGKLLSDVFPDDVAGAAMQAVHRALETHQVQVLDFRLPFDSGLRPVEARFAPSLEGTVLILLRDVTERHQAEQARHDLEAQLHHAQKMESLGCLAGGVAHDLNNVLGAILGLATTHRPRMADDDPLATAFGTIISACLRGREVITGLLRFARKDLEEERPINLNTLVRDMVRLLSHTTLQRVRLHEDLQEPLAALMGDSAALSHALMNLCVNAVDAMPDGGLLTICTREHADHSLSLAVRDTGHGMPPEVQAKAGEPFFTTKPAGKGTGLGLALVYGTMAAHDGLMEITSAPGEGTTVTLKFPAVRSVQPPSPGEVPSDRPSSRMRPLRILLVDDDELIRESVTTMLGFLGHDPISAPGGAEALAMFDQGLEVDLVILDMNMPGLSGPQTLPRLLALRPHQPVLIASGFIDETVQALLDRPTVSSISKPFTLDEIRRKVAQLDCGTPP